jgi:hypothetical protein
MGPAELATFRRHPAIAGPPVGDQNAGKGPSYQLLGHLAATAQPNEKDSDRAGNRRPQPGTTISFPPARLIEVNHRVMLDKAARLSDRLPQSFTGGTL